MIIKNIKLFICLFAIAVLFSCKKESTYDPFPTNSGIPLIKEMSFYDSIGNFIQWQSMEYNSRGWIKLQRSYFPPHYDTLTLRYEYYPGRVIESQFDLNNRKTHKNIYELNTEGLAESKTSIDYKSNGDSVVILGETDHYNSEGYMTEAYYLPDDTVHWYKENYQIGDNNIVSSRYSDKYGPGQLRTFTFFDESVNTIGNYNMGITWHGKSNKELMKSSTYESSASQALFYNYTYDAQNRVIIVKYREPNPSVGSIDLRIEYY